MMKKALLIGVVVMILMLVIVSVSWAAGPISSRQINQQHRIASGVKSGAIVPWELRRLEQEQWRIQRAKRYAWADGWISPAERYHIDRLQDRASHNIRKAKHNATPYRYRTLHRYHSYPRRIYYR
jgi:hypothetical protein